VARGYIEPSAAEVAPETPLQFERLGYFVADRRDHASDRPVFNRSVTLRDTWARQGGG
jgi:glutaminyl-tRNA synthetase